LPASHAGRGRAGVSGTRDPDESPKKHAHLPGSDAGERYLDQHGCAYGAQYRSCGIQTAHGPRDSLAGCPDNCGEANKSDRQSHDVPTGHRLAIDRKRARLPHIGRDGDVYFAHGYSGLGVLLSTLAGKLLAEAMAGETRRFDLFAGLEPPAFPGGTALRGPLHVLGMLWYAMRDRL